MVVFGGHLGHNMAENLGFDRISFTIWPRNGLYLAEISSYYGYGEKN